MRKMKPSGVEWIGDIPQEWEIALIKYSIKWKSEKGKPDATVLSLYRDYGIVPKDSRDDNYNVTSLDTSGYKVVDIGDFVINKMKAWQGSMAISAYHGIVSPAYHVCEIINDNVYKKYFHYLLRSDLYITEYTRLSKGLRIGQWDLDFNDFKNLPFLIPPLSEQKRIAEFLDRKCAEIDSVISKTKATIEQYKALKQSVITQAVTKGIRLGRPMKDSGIEWIGEIPQEWKISKLKYLCQMQAGKNLTSEEITSNGEYPVYGGNGIRGYYNEFNTVGSHLLVGRQGALCGNVHKVEGYFWATEHCVVTLCSKLSYRDYFHHTYL